MPRHPPNALMTLDHSHCQCPSLFDCFGKPCPLACACGVPKRPCLQPHKAKWKHRTAQNPCKDQDHSKNQDYLLQPWPDQMSSTCSDPALSTNAPAFVRHGSLRPASRDLSGDARSGNANQNALAVSDRSQKRKANQQTGCPIKSPNPHSISGRLGCRSNSNGSGLEREPLARVTPGSLQTISSLYDVSEQARARRHMQCVYFSKG